MGQPDTSAPIRTRCTILKMSLMANMSSWAMPLRQECWILLKFTSGKSLYLNNMLYVPSLRRNLVSSSLLDIAGFEVNQKAEKVMILCLSLIHI